MVKNRWATVVRYGGVGDNLVVSSVLSGLKKRFDGVEVLTQSPQSVVFENNPYVDKLSVYKQNQIPGAGWQEWHMIRAHESELFVNLSHSMETTLAFLPGQCQFQWPVAARRKLADKSYLEMVHDICGIPYDEIAPGFFPTEKETHKAKTLRAKLGPSVVGWVITGTRFDKGYPFSPMAVARLIADLGTDVVMFGHPEKDRAVADVIYNHVVRQNGSDKGLHFARNRNPSDAAWPLRDVLTLVQHCDLVIGPDTGPMWAVAMCDMPKIVLLSHASPTNITKHWRCTVALHANQERVPCWPCHRLHDIPDTCTLDKEGHAAACMADISVETIIQTAKEALAAPLVHGFKTKVSQALSPVAEDQPLERCAVDQVLTLGNGSSLPFATTTRIWPDSAPEIG